MLLGAGATCVQSIGGLRQEYTFDHNQGGDKRKDSGDDQSKGRPVGTDAVKCPGQNKQYWKPEDIFEAKCSRCGNLVEFFKDDPSRRCSKCGTRMINPRILQDCAQWCEYAKECLGFDPRFRAKGIASR